MRVSFFFLLTSFRCTNYEIYESIYSKQAVCYKKEYFDIVFL